MREPDRVLLLNEAARLTAGDREADYGNPQECHARIAAIFNAMTGRDLTAMDAALFHVATKLGRIQTSPHKTDNYVDAMAYLGIAYECRDE